MKKIREELVSLGVEDEELLSQSKKPLVELLLKAKEYREQEDDGTLTFDSEEENILSAVDSEALSQESELVRPAFNSEKWSEWVMSKFTDDELENGAPTCDGLRRVAEDIFRAHRKSRGHKK